MKGRASSVCAVVGCPGICDGYFCSDHAEPDLELSSVVAELAELRLRTLTRDPSRTERDEIWRLEGELEEQYTTSEPVFPGGDGDVYAEGHIRTEMETP